MLNYFKIKKLKKLKQNTYYARCKKDYQRLNETGKKVYSNFTQYAKDWHFYKNIQHQWRLKENSLGYYMVSGLSPIPFEWQMQFWRYHHSNT